MVRVPPKRIRLVPPRRAVAEAGKNPTDECYTPESLRLHQIRSLLLDSADRPVRVVGSCGYGRWRAEKGGAA